MIILNNGLSTLNQALFSEPVKKNEIAHEWRRWPRASSLIEKEI